MARGDWGKDWKAKLTYLTSYKRITLLVCFINIVIALYVLRSLYASIYVYSDNDFHDAVKYAPNQIRKMEESIRIRRASEPKQLLEVLKRLKGEFSRELPVVKMSQGVKQRITDEILQRLRSLDSNASVTDQREAVEIWRKEKLQEVKNLTFGSERLHSTILQEEAGMLVRALEFDWDALSEDIGLWIPAEIIHEEHDDKPKGAEDNEEEILPGRPVPAECHAELHTDYDGVAVRWGLTHHKESAADCCEACLDQAKQAKPGEKQCNIWVYCPSETGCHSPDIYEHKNQECWLKYAEKPRVNFKDRYSESYRSLHPNAPTIVPWVSGVTSV